MVLELNARKYRMLRRVLQNKLSTRYTYHSISKLPHKALTDDIDLPAKTAQAALMLLHLKNDLYYSLLNPHLQQLAEDTQHKINLMINSQDQWIASLDLEKLQEEALHSAQKWEDYVLQLPVSELDTPIQHKTFTIDNANQTFDIENLTDSQEITPFGLVPRVGSYLLADQHAILKALNDAGYDVQPEEVHYFKSSQIVDSYLSSRVLPQKDVRWML